MNVVDRGNAGAWKATRLSTSRVRVAQGLVLGLAERLSALRLQGQSSGAGAKAYLLHGRRTEANGEQAGVLLRQTRRKHLHVHPPGGPGVTDHSSLVHCAYLRPAWRFCW